MSINSTKSVNSVCLLLTHAHIHAQAQCLNGYFLIPLCQLSDNSTKVKSLGNA